MMKWKQLCAAAAVAAMGASSASAAMVLHFKLDDDGGGNVSTANSGSNVAYSWNSSSGATLTAGKFGGAGSFATSAGWWSNSNTGADLSSFTLSLHINAPSALNWSDYISIGDGNNSVFRLEHNGGHSSVSVYTTGTPGGGSVGINGSAPPVVNDGAWHHLAMVGDGSTIELFVDGQSKGSAAYNGSGAINALQLVGLFGGADGGRKQQALLDDVAVYDTALNAGQIGWLANNEAVANPVPEPSSAALFGLGGMALVLRRRK